MKGGVRGGDVAFHKEASKNARRFGRLRAGSIEQLAQIPSARSGRALTSFRMTSNYITGIRIIFAIGSTLELIY
jgi:hypothetical protein